MKKALVILLAIFMVGAAFAADVVAPEFSGSASVTWGYDLQSGGTGFTNANDVKVTFPMASKGSNTKGGDGMYGEITVSNFGFKLEQTGETPVFADIDGDNGFSVSAKIVLSPNFNVGIYSKPSTEIKFAEKVGAAGTDVTVGDASSTGGISLNLISDMADLKGLLVSKDGSTNGTTNEYAFKGALTLRPVKDVLTIDAAYAFNKNLASANAQQDAGAKAVVKVAPLTLTLASDMNVAPAFHYDFRADAEVAVADPLKLVAKYYAGQDFAAMNATVEATGTVADVANLKYGVLFGLDDLTGTALAWKVAVRASVTPVEDVTLAGNFSYKNTGAYDLVYDTDNSAISLTMGPKFHSIDNTTFTVKYATLAGTSSGVTDKGELTIAAKIAF
ncbi:hypothetical protein [Gracilinema caldarium]|uniref:hypothetical protein n=1 Tax=Gracilinema caldarium TaxID=215591 RepID=UPI0026EE8249|nr:hypothetical protein [Gracilinema caldarium]